MYLFFKKIPKWVISVGIWAYQQTMSNPYGVYWMQFTYVISPFYPKQIQKVFFNTYENNCTKYNVGIISVAFLKKMDKQISSLQSKYDSSLTLKINFVLFFHLRRIIICQPNCRTRIVPWNILHPITFKRAEKKKACRVVNKRDGKTNMQAMLHIVLTLGCNSICLFGSRLHSTHFWAGMHRIRM